MIVVEMDDRNRRLGSRGVNQTRCIDREERIDSRRQGVDGSRGVQGSGQGETRSRQK